MNATAAVHFTDVAPLLYMTGTMAFGALMIACMVIAPRAWAALADVYTFTIAPAMVNAGIALDNATERARLAVQEVKVQLANVPARVRYATFKALRSEPVASALIGNHGATERRQGRDARGRYLQHTYHRIPASTVLDTYARQAYGPAYGATLRAQLRTAAGILAMRGRLALAS